MREARQQKRMATLDKYLFLGLMSIEFLMSFTFLGYIHIEPISITIAYLPILIAGSLLGVWPATAMGAIFGLSSLYKASANYVMPMDKVFSPFFSGAPLQSLLLSVGTRALFGFLVGLLFQLVRASRHQRLWGGAVALLAPKLHSVLVYTAMGLLFPNLGYGLTSAFHIGVSDVLLALVCLLFVEATWGLLLREKLAGFRAYLNQARAEERKVGKLHWSWSLLLLCILCAVIASSFYFAQRMSYMLGVHGLSLSMEAEHDLLHLQMQSLFATLSISFLLAVFLLVLYRYLSYREYIGQLDAVTAVMGRKMFNHYCSGRLLDGEGVPGGGGWFLFVDVDYFKSINDTLGHPAGDMVLKKIAQALQDAFSADGGIGRMGGDEFAVLIARPMAAGELREKLDAFLGGIATVLAAPEKVTCSIGVCRFTCPQDMQTLYSQTDRLLYAAKRHGRAQYVFGELKDGEVALLDDPREKGGAG